MTTNFETLNVAGARVAALPVPRWLKRTRLLLGFLIFVTLLTCGFAIAGWSWVSDGLTQGVALTAAAGTTLAAALTLLVVFGGPLNWLLNLRKKDGVLVYGGFYDGKLRVLLPLACGLGLSALSAWSAYDSARKCPLPSSVARIEREVVLPKSGGTLHPIYFWDYATWIDPEWFSRVELVLPYERGLPRKLLPKFYFVNSETRKIELELHGRRPRSYPPEHVHEIFNSLAVHPRDWSMLWRLQKEAGLITDNVSVGTLYLLRMNHAGTSQVTQAIGVPWLDGYAEGAGAGRMFFWGPDGSVFQARCASPCALGKFLEWIQFPADPRGSHRLRLEWTKSRLRRLLAEAEPDPRLLTLYLVSLLSIDPRDPEAFFHIGKLAKNELTVRSAISYGKDLGMEPAQLLELEAVARRLSH